MAIGAAIGSAVIGAGASKSAAKSQERAANAQIALNERIFEETSAKFQPFYDDGLDFKSAYRFETLGGPRPVFGGDPLDVTEFTETVPNPSGANPLSPYWNAGRMGEPPGPLNTTRTRYRVGDQIFDERDAADAYAQANPTGGTEYQGFQATPGYQFMLDQGQKAIDNSAASTGSLFSGATLKSLQGYGQGLANQEYGNFLNRLAQGAASGQAAAGNQANAGANFLSTGTNALANLGNAQAAGAIGVGNALTGGINNAVGLWNYQNQQSQPSMFTASNGIRIPNSLFNQVQGVL